MRNPCRDCERLTCDKNDLACMGCEKRLAYVRSEGLPWDMNPLINARGMGGKTPAVAGFRPNARRNDKEGSMENQAEFKASKICKGEVCRAISLDGVSRPLSEFGPAAKAKDGHQWKCRMCVAFEFRKNNAKKTKETAPDPKDYALNYKGYKGAKSPDIKDIKDTGKAQKKSPQPPFSKGKIEGTLSKGESIEEQEKQVRPDLAGERKPAAITVFLDIRIGFDPLTIGRLKEILEPFLKGKAE